MTLKRKAVHRLTGPTAKVRKKILAFLAELWYLIKACDCTGDEKGGPLPRIRSGMNVYSERIGLWIWSKFSASGT